MSTSYKAAGVVLNVSPTRIISDKFSVREFVMEIPEERYSQFVKMQCAGRNATLLDGVSPGDTVEVEFNLRGRAYTSKKTGEEDYFTSLDCWRLSVTSAKTATLSEPAETDIPF